MFQARKTIYRNLRDSIAADIMVIPVSTITRDNIDTLLYAIANKLEVKDIDFSVEKMKRLV